MQITTQPDENDEIINLEILADHESPINKIRLHGKTRHKRNKSLLDSFKDSFKKNVQQTFSKPNSRSSSQQLVHLSRKESKAETVDQDYMAIPSERDREDGYESHRIMTTEMSERKRPNPSRFEYRDTQGDEKDDEGEEEDKIELVDLPEIPSRSAESPFSQLRESILFNSVHGNNDLNEVVIKSTTSSEPDNKDKVLRTTSAASERWRSAKFALNAVTFNKGAEEALERRHALIMRGHTIEKLLKRKDIKFYINPHGVFKKMWDLIILITLIYYSFLAPVRWSQRVHSSAWVSVDAVLDALTGIDIILFFFTAIIEPTRTIKDNKQIVIQYLKTYFLFDLIAVLPFYKINQDTYIIKFLRVIHLPRIYQVLSSFVIGFPRGQKFLNFTKAFYLFCAALNFLTAIWIFPGEVPKGSVSWMASVTGFDPADTFANIWTLFITGAAFIVTTITTVGYGDIVPKNTTEDVVDMIFMFLGVILTGLLQGQLTYVMKADYKKQIQEVNTELEAWVLKLEHSRKVFRSEKGQDKYVDAIPPTKEMQTCFKFFNFHNLNPLTWHSEFFPELKPSAQNHVTFLIFSTVIQRFSVFFRFFNDEAFIKDLVTTLVPKILSPREIIFRRGGHAKGLYFIIKGHVVLSYKETSLVTLREGSFFGESSLLERKCMVDYIAGNEDLQCLYLPKKLVIEICEIYPEQKCLLQRIIYERADYYKKIISGIFIGTQNRFDEYTPFHARSQPENNGGRRSTKILRKAFMKEYINTSQTEQNISKDNHLKSPGLPEPFVFSYEDKPIMSNANLESCNYLSRTASFAHNIIPSFHASPTLFQPSPTSIVPQSPVNASPNLKPSAYQVTKPRDSIVPSIVIMSPRGQQQFNGFIPGQMDLILQPRQSAQSALLGNSMITEDQISDPDQEVDENQDIASTSSESEDEEDGGDSDSDASDLNNSLEVPLETIEPDFQDLKQFDKILQYVDERISSFDFHIKRVDLSSREKLLQEWKNMRAILKRVHPDLKEDGNIAEARIQEKPE